MTFGMEAAGSIAAASKQNNPPLSSALALRKGAGPAFRDHVRLDVSFNSIGEEGLKALAAYERQSSTLKSLPLDGIHIGSGVWEEASDWDGSGGYSYEKSLSVKERREKFGFPTMLKT